MTRPAFIEDAVLLRNGRICILNLPPSINVMQFFPLLVEMLSPLREGADYEFVEVTHGGED